jgi:hypothetical protein
MEQSILKSTKKILGLEADDTSFDLDVLTHVNGAFSTLQQLGVGPAVGFMIEDDTEEWDDYEIDEMMVNSVKQYVFLKTKMLFDPPTTSYQQTSFENQIKELEWRLNARREETDWTPPVPTQGVGVIDGGEVV